MKGTVPYPVKCPSCGTEQTMATSIHPGENIRPRNGDFSICFDCGSLFTFDDRHASGLRALTEQEQLMAALDDDIQSVLREWRRQHVP